MAEEISKKDKQETYKDKLIEICKILLQFQEEFNDRHEKLYNEEEMQTYQKFVYISDIERKRTKVRAKAQKLELKRNRLLYPPSKDPLLSKYAQELLDQIKTLKREEKNVSSIKQGPKSFEIGDFERFNNISLPELENIFMNLHLHGDVNS